VPAPIPEDKRLAILADVRTETKSQRQVARDHGVSTTAVRKIAHDAGLTNAFSREVSKRATAARIADQRAQRAITSQRFLDESNWFLDQLHKPHLVHSFGGKENSYNEHTLPQPPTTDLRNLMVSAGVAFDKHIAADRHDAETGAEGARSVLGALGQALQMAAEDLGEAVGEPGD
jgi:transposase-like protein